MGAAESTPISTSGSSSGPAVAQDHSASLVQGHICTSDDTFYSMLPPLSTSKATAESTEASSRGQGPPRPQLARSLLINVHTAAATLDDEANVHVTTNASQGAANTGQPPWEERIQRIRMSLQAFAPAPTGGLDDIDLLAINKVSSMQQRCTG